MVLPIGLNQKQFVPLPSFDGPIVSNFLALAPARAMLKVWNGP